MYTIDLSKHKSVYNPQTKTFSMSEKGIPFGTVYEILNPWSESSKIFTFEHATGPEFDPATKWIYKCDDLTLEICNDANMTKIAARNYLEAKTRKF